MRSSLDACGSTRPHSLLFNLSSIFVFCALAGAALAQTAFVRVNQVGYVSGASKRAYLMASGAETGATFVVKNSSGSTVFGPAAIGANLGSWSNAYPDIYALDFDSFTTAGTYTISVSGPIAASSPSFKVDTAANVYTGALSNSLFFYQNERDGPNFVGTALRTAAGHLNDQSAKVYVTPNVNNNGRDVHLRTLIVQMPGRRAQRGADEVRTVPLVLIKEQAVRQRPGINIRSRVDLKTR